MKWPALVERLASGARALQNPSALDDRPAPPRGLPPLEPLWLEWLTLAGLLACWLAGLLAFGSWLLGGRGVWALLLSSDPRGLTLVIIIVFLCGSLWSGARARELQKQHVLLRQAMAANAHKPSTSTKLTSDMG